MKLKRREIITVSGQSVLAAYCGWLSGCGLAPDSSLREEDGSKTMYGLKMEGWSTLGSGYLGSNGTLDAQIIKNNQAHLLHSNTHLQKFITV